MAQTNPAVLQNSEMAQRPIQEVQLEKPELELTCTACDEESEVAQWPIREVLLEKPELAEVATVLQNGLKAHYADVTVEVVDCPDLTQSPYGLTASGLGGGRPCIIDVGGIDNLFPRVNADKEYCLKEIAERTGRKDFHLVGAGSCGYSLIKCNSELVVNAGHDHIKSLCARMVDNHKKICCEPYKSYRCSALANVFCSKGETGKVLKFHAKKRIGKTPDFIACVQQVLKDKYGERPVSLGGSFQMLSGKAKVHVMSDFTQNPIQKQEFIDKEWLKYIEAEAPFTFMTVCTSVSPPGLDMRLTHTHGHSTDQSPMVGGHYHYDLSPDEIEYEGFFGVAESIVRVDQVSQTPDFFKAINFRTNPTSLPGTPEPSPMVRSKM